MIDKLIYIYILAFLTANAFVKDKRLSRSSGVNSRLFGPPRLPSPPFLLFSPVKMSSRGRSLYSVWNRHFSVNSGDNCLWNDLAMYFPMLGRNLNALR
jgi:hypothetical protein